MVLWRPVSIAPDYREPTGGRTWWSKVGFAGTPPLPRIPVWEYSAIVLPVPAAGLKRREWAPAGSHHGLCLTWQRTSQPLSGQSCHLKGGCCEEDHPSSAHLSSACGAKLTVGQSVSLMEPLASMCRTWLVAIRKVPCLGEESQPVPPVTIVLHLVPYHQLHQPGPDYWPFREVCGDVAMVWRCLCEELKLTMEGCSAQLAVQERGSALGSFSQTCLS